MSRLGIFKAKPAPAPIVTSAPPLTAEQKREATNASYWDAVEGNTDEERLWGLENFGNTCYCNSVLQALYNCEPFKQFVESYPSIPPPSTALGPPPGEANFPKKDDPPSSPLATKRDNPFDSPAASSPARGFKFGRRQSSIAQEKPATPVEKAPERRIPLANYPVLPLPDPNQPPPSVFESIQTLFHHLTVSPPHQPLPSRKDPKKEQEQVQTASVLAAPSTPTSPTENKDVPQGPPLLASLPPPSAPRGGGPFQAGSLGRGVVRPEDVLKTIKRENEMFRGMAQQDAHEFLGWVLNKVSEEVEQVDKHLKGTRGRTFVQNLFEGCLTNETRCLSCETTSSRDELFLDLSIDIEQHTSVSACLRGFSASEMLYSKNKFFCESCAGLQEAEKRMKIKRLPNILALHLKRFKYQESLGRYTKLFYRVPFPLELRLPNTSDDAENPDRLYELFAVVVHIGNGPHHGHYVCIVKSAGRWIMCDDENIEPIEEDDIFRYFGDYPSGAGYVLFYQAADLDVESLGLKGAKRSGRSNKKTAKAPPAAFSNAASTALAPPITNGDTSAPLSAIQQSPPSSPPLPDEISPRTKPEPTVPNVPVPTSAPPTTASFNQPKAAPAPIRASLPPRADSNAPLATPMTASSTGTSYTTGTAATLNTANTTGSAGEREKKDKWYSLGKKDDTSSRSREGSESFGRKPSFSMGRQPSISRSTSQAPGQAQEGRERQASGGSYNGGGGLGRKLSGIGGKMQRSGSLMKLGLGKNKKEENINEH